MRECNIRYSWPINKLIDIFSPIFVNISYQKINKYIKKMVYKLKGIFGYFVWLIQVSKKTPRANIMNYMINVPEK